MKYITGQTSKIGDIVQFDDGARGVVVCSIDDHEYSEDYPESSWSYLGKGVMIEFEKYGLFHFIEADEELSFVSRGPGKGIDTSAQD